MDPRTPSRGLPSQPQDAGGRRFTPGELIDNDRYYILALVGVGGMADVYQVADHKLEQSVALKHLRRESPSEPLDPGRVRKEVIAARQVTHPHVCRVYDVGEHDGESFLTMELIDGPDFAKLLRQNGPIAGQRLVEIAQQLCAGLTAIHEAGLLHLDLKPANVMLDDKGRVRIMDLGLAAVSRGPGELIGTPAYMAPEQLRGEGVTVQTDIYAIGLVLYELSTGRRAFTAGSIAEALEVRKVPPAPPRAFAAGIDPRLERAILACLAESPSQRPATARSLLKRLAPTKDTVAPLPSSRREHHDPFSLFQRASIRLRRSRSVQTKEPGTVRVALISLPELPLKIRRFSTSRGAAKEDAATYSLATFTGPAATRLLATFKESVTTAVETMKADVVCVNELGFPSRYGKASRAAKRFTFGISRKLEALVVAGSAHHSDTRFNTGYLYYPGGPSEGIAFHKGSSAVNIGELIQTPSRHYIEAVDVFGLRIAVVFAWDLADFGVVNSLSRMYDDIHIILVPSYSAKTEKLTRVVRFASQAIPGVVAMVNPRLSMAVSPPVVIARMGMALQPTRSVTTSTGATVCTFEIDLDDFHTARYEERLRRGDLPWAYRPPSP